MSDEHEGHRRAPGWGATKWIFPGFAAIAGFFLVTEHTAHVLGALPWALLALCPLMYFMHGGHGGHGAQQDEMRRIRGTTDPAERQKLMQEHMTQMQQRMNMMQMMMGQMLEHQQMMEQGPAK